MSCGYIVLLDVLWVRLAVQPQNSALGACVKLWLTVLFVQVTVGSTKAVTYTDPSLKDRMSIDEDYSLVLMGLDVVDTANYTCRAFVLNATLAQMENHSITLELIVQGE